MFSKQREFAFVNRILVVISLSGVFANIQCTGSTPPKFEVASVKPCGADRTRKGDGVDSSPDRLHLPCMTALMLIQQAYGNFANDHFDAFASVPIWGGPQWPKWANSDRYQIDAKADGPRGRGTMNGSMLRALLEDRFKLKTHRESRESAVYALTVAKDGPKLQPFQKGSCMAVDFSDPDRSPLPEVAPGRPFPLICGGARLSDNGYDLPGATMAAFCTDLSAKLDRPTIDETGIPGLFNIHLDLSDADLGLRPKTTGDSVATPPDPSEILGTVNSAIRKLGLYLKPSKALVEFLVLDYVEKPSEN